MKLQHRIGLLLGSFFLAFLDQISKWIADATLVFGKTQAILPFFNLRLAYNKGAGFSFLSQHDWGSIILVVISWVFVAAVGVVILRAKHFNKELIALSILLGGALGNGIDRLFLGYVIDFLDFYYPGTSTYHFPTFNLADAWITLGALVWVYALIRFNKTPQ